MFVPLQPQFQLFSVHYKWKAFQKQFESRVLQARISNVRKTKLMQFTANSQGAEDVSIRSIRGRSVVANIRKMHLKFERNIGIIRVHFFMN